MKNRVCVIGGGPVGSSLGVALRRHGFEVSIFERNCDIRSNSIISGRSINLVLTKRGLRLAQELNLENDLMKFVVEVRGRCVHSLDGFAFSQAYGLDGECNYSINRSLLNKFWISQAETEGCRFFFGHVLESLTCEGLKFLVEGQDPVVVKMSEFDYIFACDGAGSSVRANLARAGLLESDEKLLNSVYKEVVFPSAPDGSYTLDSNLLHIWPRTGHMLMALANTDGSFTGTVFMDKETSTEACATPDSASSFLHTHYHSALEILTPPQIEDTVSNLVNYREGILGTVHCSPWLVESLSTPILLLGDAAHGIVPFFGQGVNCGFEDVYVFNKLISGNSISDAMKEFARYRKTDTDAIAAMALENFEEMKSHVANEEFLKLKKIEAEIMKKFPKLYRSRYTMVMYSSNPYSVCRAMGEVQRTFLSKVANDPENVEALLDEYITPAAKQLGVSFDF